MNFSLFFSNCVLVDSSGSEIIIQGGHELNRMGVNNGSGMGGSSTSSRGVGMRYHHGGGGHGGQWKPVLQSISEIGT